MSLTVRSMFLGRSPADSGAHGSLLGPHVTGEGRASVADPAAEAHRRLELHESEVVDHGLAVVQLVHHHVRHAPRLLRGGEREAPQHPALDLVVVSVESVAQFDNQLIFPVVGFIVRGRG